MRVKRKKIPQIGDKIIITDYDTFPGGNETARIAKLPYLTIESILPIKFSDDDGYYIDYEVYVNETDYLIGIDWDYYN